MSEEATASQNHAKRIAYLEKQIEKARKKNRIGLQGFIYIGSIWFCFLFPAAWWAWGEKGLAATQSPLFYGFILIGLSSFGLGVFALWHSGKTKLLEKEFAKIATPEDWLRRETPQSSESTPSDEWLLPL